MTEKRRHYYEGLFLFGQAALSDLSGAVDHLRDILTRAGAEIIAMRKWDERRLAFEIRKHKRGLFVLTYFQCDAPQMAAVERDCNLSEHIIRSIVIRADHLTVDEMRAADAQRELADEAALRRDRPDRPERAAAETPEAAGAGVGAAEESEDM